MKALRVRDIMTEKVFTLPAKAKVEEAARELTARRISGAPVLDQGRVVGVLSKSDLVDTRVRSEGLTVEEVMTSLIFAVRPGDPAMLAVRLMLEEGIHRAMVVGAGGDFLGIVTPMDALRAIVQGGQLESEEERLERVAVSEHAEAAVAVQYVDLREVLLRE